MNTEVKLFNDLYIVDIGLYSANLKTLFIADSHLGYEDALAEEGIFVPRINLKLIKQRLEKVFSNLHVERIVFNGDLKHEFGDISKQEWFEVLEFIDFLKAHGELVIVKGNHDTMLNPIAKKKNVKIVENALIDKYFITHGHKFEKPPKNAKASIIAHEHPAISLREGGRIERFKCFLCGKSNGKTLIVLPSLLQVVEGTDLLNENLLSPYLQEGIEDFKIWIVEDKPYYFGKIRQIIKIKE